MGRDERINEIRKELGRYNVHISILYTDGHTDEADIKSWTHAGNFLALDYGNNQKLEVISLVNVYKFTITPQESMS